jgi:hypothetical protein
VPRLPLIRLARARREYLVVGLLVTGLAALFVVVQRGSVATYDGQIVYTVARSIVHGRLTVDPSLDAYGMHTPYSSYGIDISLVVALQQALGLSAPVLVTLANPILLTVAGGLLYPIGRRLGWSSRLCVFVAMGYAGLTMALQDSQDLFSEPGIALGLALIVLGLLRWQGAAGARTLDGPLLVGVGLGIAILFRADSLLLLAPLLLLTPWVVPDGWRRPLAWVTAAGPVLPALAWTAFYSYQRSGTVVPQQYGISFSTPLLHGLDGLLLSPGKSLFVFNPVLLISIPGAVLLFRRHRGLTVLLGAFVVLRILFYARWRAWEGGVSWGPRFLMPCVVPLLLFAGEALRRIPALPAVSRRVAVVAVASLVAASAVVSAASVWVPFEASYRAALPTPGLKGEAAHAAQRKQIDRYMFTIEPSAIPWNLRHWDGARGMRNFRDGVTGAGLLEAVIAVVAAGGALVLAESAPRAGRGDRHPGVRLSAPCPSPRPLPVLHGPPPSGRRS